MSIQELDTKRARHGLTTFWLIYMVINGIASIVSFSLLRKDIETFLKIPLSDEYCRYLIIIGAINAISALLLLYWKKIGFHGIIIASILNLYVNLQLTSEMSSAFLSLMQIAVLYLVLKLKKNNKTAWEQLT